MTKTTNFSLNAVTMDLPSYILNCPFSINNNNPNNIWMNEDDEPINVEVAVSQWMDLYQFLGSNGFVQNLPTPIGSDLQDLTYVANLGIVLTHLNGEKPVVIIANFTSEPRYDETKIGVDFFKNAGYEVHVCPFKFEGEAELKHIKDNLYIGGYGQRTDIQAFEWMEEHFGMKIIKVEMRSLKTYHFDCLCFPITTKDILLCKSLCSKEEVAEIEAEGINIIDVPLEFAESGVTNNVRVGNLVLNSSDIYELDRTDDAEDWHLENDKNEWLIDTLLNLGMEPVFVNLSELTKSGAMLSCCVMHANRASYNIDYI